ncbi:MAG: hypothetical protein JNM69_26435 [Archangium sp.]|nr:hypothetical protein [Archangium sp.]
MTNRKLRAEVEAETGELTLVPYLDILMNLILFMILSMTGLGAMKVINATRAAGQGSGDGAPVSVVIDESGYVIRQGEQVTTVPRRNGAPALKAALEPLRRGSRLLLSASSAVPFEVLVETMDAARTTADGKPLFPDVTLE